MALSHAQSGQPVSLLPLGTALAGTRTTALFKAHDLEVVRVVLPAGKALRQHAVPGEITVQCLEGRVELTIDGAVHRLEAGQLVFLAGGLPHGLLALDDASVLVTIALRPNPAA